MQIDPETGCVTLSNGVRLSKALTPEALLALPLHAKPYALSGVPFQWFTSAGGVLERRALQIEYCFFEQRLVSLDLHITLTEQELLEKIPTGNTVGEEFYSLVVALAFGEYRSRYSFLWGEVSLLLSPPAIRVEHAGRRDNARIAYQKVNKAHNWDRIVQFRRTRISE